MELSEQQLLEASIKNITGSAHIEYSVAYSDYTGYLWTDQYLNIGGHSLRGELDDNIGKYVYLKIIVNE